VSLSAHRPRTGSAPLKANDQLVKSSSGRTLASSLSTRRRVDEVRAAAGVARYRLMALGQRIGR
jgi:hypothetical protein